ncbi:uncharacterized protein LOC105793239 [Gossypium raimondii]|uniref:uncharacterized protein LOC105793239 n=1 Tax=Gossypium raimondii TaxID=29730 RepID=UPI00063AC3BF|nr:uncharacterized protein LOC105793239 [Gossypium raimondii]
MCNYVKVTKKFLSMRRRLRCFEIIALRQECSSYLQNKLPPKMKDHGSFTIPCSIRDSYCGMALGDLGASINLMSMFVFNQLGIGEARPTTVTLQLVVRSLAHLDGKIKDVLVHKKVPIILERPFLATGKTLTDVQKCELTMRIQDEQVTFNVLKAIRSPNGIKEYSVVPKMLEKLVGREYYCFLDGYDCFKKWPFDTASDKDNSNSN